MKGEGKMVEIEAINSIRFSFNQLFDMLEQEMAEDEEIDFVEFRRIYRGLEMAKEDLNDIYDFVIMMLIRRRGLEGEYME
jgi:hypothetical protein